MGKAQTVDAVPALAVVDGTTDPGAGAPTNGTAALAEVEAVMERAGRVRRMPKMETATLAQVEHEIAVELEHFKKAGLRLGALLQVVRDRGLYKGGSYATFEAYCETRWQISRGRAYQLIEANDVVGLLSTRVDIEALPANPKEALALAPLKEEPAKMAEAMTEAVAEAKAEGKPVTAGRVRAAVAKRVPKAKPAPASPPADPDRYVRAVARAINHGYVDLIGIHEALTEKGWTVARIDEAVGGQGECVTTWASLLEACRAIVKLGAKA